VIGEVAVIVPAADEEDTVADCLVALRAAGERLRAGGSAAALRLVVTLDDCRDRTAQRVAAFAEVEAVPITRRCVGAARAAATAHVLRTALDVHSLWLANTDADSRVPANWLVEMVRAAERGSELVVGTVLPSDDLPPATYASWLERHDFADGHPHVHGANLGIRADRLVSLGGWAELATGEDVDLVARAVAAGAVVCRTGSIPVRTSARAVGRAPKGFSSYLRALASEPAPVGGL
jgi:cellulose synthase/poly-beta-1,6-N-acetylglucosamine synthase-like glycosyltransferase